MLKQNKYTAFALLDPMDIETYDLSPYTHLTLVQTRDNESQCLHEAFASVPHAFWLTAVDVAIFHHKYGVVLDLPEVARQELAHLFDPLDLCTKGGWKNGKTAHLCCRSYQEAHSLIGKSLCFSTLVYKQVGRHHIPLFVYALPHPHSQDPLTAFPRAPV